MKILTFQMGLEELSEHSDDVKALVLNALVADGMVQETDAERWCDTHTIIVSRRRWWHTLLKPADRSWPDGLLRLLVVLTPEGGKPE